MRNFKLFQDESVYTGSKPFFNEWIASHPLDEIKCFLIEKVQASKKGNGFLVSTEEFTLFLWKNNEVTRNFVEAITFYAEQGYGPSFLVVVKDSQPLIAMDEDNTSFFKSKNGVWSISEVQEEQPTTLSHQNPFMPQAASLPQTPSTKTKKTSSQRPLGASPRPSQEAT